MLKTIRAAAAAALFLAAVPAMADEVEQTLQAALDAYRAGDVATAQQEVDFAASLLAKMKAESLAAYLPDALEGWQITEENAGAQMAAMMGGGLVANRSYQGPDGENVDITLMADNPMVASLGAMFGNAALAGSMGEMRRIAGQRAVVTPDGEINAMVANRFLVQVAGSATVEDKESYFGAIDFEALGQF
ncbi:MAG: hypothetical protein AAF371_12685 [Pseudomonadota bacterium]